jgi:hypothetical protein
MTSQFVYYSQQDPKWKQDIFGFGDPGDTIGYISCALTSVSMLISGHGFSETLKSLNQKIKNVNGLASTWHLEKTQTTAPDLETVPVSRSTGKELSPASYQLIVVIKSRAGKFGAKVYETESVKSHIVSTEKIHAKLIVVEDVSKARPKIGKAGKWLRVQTREGKKGFVNAKLVALAE